MNIFLRLLLVVIIIFGLTKIIKAQTITCLPCDQLGMSVNVGSQETSISLYHSGQYLTHPRSENFFVWNFSDQQGTLLYQDTIVVNAFCNLFTIGH